MDEENNNEKQENGVVKDTVKSLGKLALKKVKKWIIIGALCLAGLLLVVGLLHLVEYEVKNRFTNMINNFKISSAEDAEYVSSETNDSVIYIDKNGKYKLKEDYSEQILKELKEQKVNNNVMGFNLDDEDDEKLFKDMIDTYIKAEVATTFPNTGDSFWDIILLKSNDVEGNITIKRAKADGSGPEKLTYKKYETFCSMIEEDNTKGTTKALDYFSLNPENFMLCIATKESETEYFNVDANGNPTSVSKTGGNLKIDELNYRKQLENYAVPLNFTITMHLISQDVDFMKELVELATGANKVDPLELTYVDSQQQYITEYSYTGKTEEIVQSILASTETTYDDNSVKQLLTEDAIAGLSVGSVFTSKEINNDNASLYYNDAVRNEKQVTTTYSGRLYITKADTWLKTSERTVTKLPNETISSDPITNDIIIDPRNYTYTITNDIESPTPPITKVMTTQETIQLTQTDKYSSSSIKYSIVDTNSEIVVKEFLDLIEKYPKVKNRISTAPSNIFYLLQQNENTQKLEKIMRYVLYELNDVNYGVTEADLDYLLKDQEFISVGGLGGGGIYGGTLAEKIWFALRDAGYSEYAAAGALGNLFCESDNLVANRVQYGSKPRTELGYNDETYTAAVDSGEYTREQFKSDGAGYGLAQWTDPGRKANLYDFAKNEESSSIGDEDMQIKFLLKELAGYNLTSWMNSESPEEAAENFCNTYERPDIYGPDAKLDYDEVIGARQKKAREFYEELQGRTPGTFQPNTNGDIRVRGYYTTRGRTFTILNQNYCSDWGGKCNRAAATMIASGYANQDVDTLIKIMDDNYSANTNNRDPIIPPTSPYFELYGLERIAFWQSTYQTLDVEEYKNTLRDCLQQGGYAVVWLSCGGTYKGESGLKWTGNVHWVPILDYRNTNGKEEIYVADWQHDGWFSFDEFKNGISGYALIREQ